MTGTTFFEAVRRGLNDTVAATYKWTTAELVDDYNWAVNNIARDTGIFRDAFTPALDTISIAAGTPDYPLDSRILEITSALISGNHPSLIQTDLTTLNSENSLWRYQTISSGTDISFADNTPLADSIASTTTDFESDGLEAGEYIEVTGAVAAGNNSTFLTSTITDHLITLTTAATLATAVATPRITIKQLLTGTPTRYLTDYRDGYITLSPCPDFSGSLFIHTLRTQLTALTEATIATLTTLPLHEDYQIGLIDGVLHRAFLKSGPNTFNYEKSKLHLGLFDKLKLDIARDKIKKESLINNVMKAHKGMI